MPVTYTATGTPIVPGSSMPVYTVSTSNAAVPNPPVGTATGTVGTIGTVAPSFTTSSAPIATGAAYKVGAGSVGAVAVAGLAMLL